MSADLGMSVIEVSSNQNRSRADMEPRLRGAAHSHRVVVVTDWRRTMDETADSSATATNAYSVILFDEVCRGAMSRNVGNCVIALL